MSDLGSDGEVADGFGVLVTPADVGADRVVLLAVAAVVGAAECEVPQRGELALDAVQPGRVGRQEHQFHVVADAPFPHLAAFVDRIVVCDRIQPLTWPPSAQGLEEGQELCPAFAVADAVVKLPGTKIQRTEHVPHALDAVVGRTQPFRCSPTKPAAPGAGLQVQRPELVHADHAPVGRRIVVQVEHPLQLLAELGFVAGFPGLGGLPRHPHGAQDLPQCSLLMSAISLCRNTSTSFDKLHVENCQPRSRGQHRAMEQIRSRVA